MEEDVKRILSGLFLEIRRLNTIRPVSSNQKTWRGKQKIEIMARISPSSFKIKSSPGLSFNGSYSAVPIYLLLFTITLRKNAANLSFVNVVDGILVISLITETGEND